MRGLRNPKLWITLLSTGGVLYFTLGDLTKTAPGPLASVHQRDAKLRGWNRCSACHGGWFRTMTQSCLVCHREIETDLGNGTGLHGHLPADRAKECARCHTDHHGERFVMVNQRSFALAGFADVKAFKHDSIGFAMAGRHLQLACTKCHVHAEAVELPEGAKRYLGLQKGCAACHRDAHEGRMKLACASCHGQESFDRLHADGHERHLVLDGAHGRATCRTCHATGEHGLESLGRGRSVAPRLCADCHQSPHNPSFVEGVAKLEGVAPGASCAKCHAAAHGGFRGERVTVTASQHALSGFALAEPHAKVKCASCHTAAESSFAARYPGRGASSCGSCHQDPHGGQFGTGPAAAATCVTCHDSKHFKPHGFTAERHASTKLPLTGRHLEADCNRCHVDPVAGAARAFRGTDDTCAKCHTDAHGGFFQKTLAGLAPHPHGDCARCHATTAFSALPTDGFDHARWTGFALRGAHSQSTCESCHAKTAKPDAAGRTFGR
ncbi:MAG: hypothetical protein KDC87_19625, partial [Planctomycetes bacterium]|nr:hypothetical protein [Planctomycetota bacterium]